TGRQETELRPTRAVGNSREAQRQRGGCSDRPCCRRPEGISLPLLRGGLSARNVLAADDLAASRRMTVLRKTLILALAAVLVTLAASAKVHAWGAYHAGYTHVGPNGAYHVGGTRAYGGYGGYGGAHYSGYHYGGAYGGGGGYHYGYAGGYGG